MSHVFGSFSRLNRTSKKHTVTEHLVLGAFVVSGLSGTTAYFGSAYVKTECYNSITSYNGPYDLPFFILSFPETISPELTDVHRHVEGIIKTKRMVPDEAECVANEDCNSEYCNLEGQCDADENTQFEKRISHFQLPTDTYNVKCTR